MFSNQVIGSAGASAQGYSDAKVAVAPSRLDHPAAHLEEMAKGLHDLTSRLSRVADRFGGTQPEPVEKEGRGSSVSGICGRYESVADVYSMLLRRLGATVDRLEQF